ncbi:MAG: hypothetical protein IT362_04410 [Deltaproteobacteria bacterium]|nr:hypothetical protein [Deltaproteobacteria bacterium]
MTFKEFLKIKKGIDTDGKDVFEFMDDYYDEYMAFLRSTKDGCGPK